MLLFISVTQPIHAADWVAGDVFVAISDGKYQVYNNNGVFKETISDGFGGFTTGCAFNPSLDKLYTTDFSATKVIVFDDAHPHSILQTVDTNSQISNGHSESIVFAANGDFYVGHPDGSADILRYDSAGVFQQSLNVDFEDRGSDWTDLAADQRTLFYTSEGARILRYDVASDVQLGDFANLGVRPSFALRLLPPGDGSAGLLVANTSNIKRLDEFGMVVQTYDVGGEDGWFALNLDPNGTSFWSGDFGTSNFYRFNIASGAIEVGPINTGTAPGTLFGICLKGELTAAVDESPPSCSGISSTTAVPGIDGTVKDEEAFDTGVVSVVLGAATNLTLTVDAFTPPASPVTFLVEPTDPSIEAIGGVIATDDAGNFCELSVSFPVLPPGKVDNVVLCEGGGIVFSASNESTEGGTSICSQNDPDADDTALPPGYEPPPLGVCTVQLIDAPFGGLTEMVLKVDGTFNEALRIVYVSSPDGGMTFPPEYIDVTVSVDPITTIIPDPTRLKSKKVNWSVVKVTCAELAEICDGIDNDGDGDIDEGLPITEFDVNVDGDGFVLCPDPTSGDPPDCNDQLDFVYPGAPELCNGIDDNCDGQRDEGNPEGGEPCTVPGLLGACAESTTSCLAGPLVCDQTVDPVTEDCDGIDNDCNGLIDENLTQATNCGFGACLGNAGIKTCVSGTFSDTCDPLAGASTEICDDGIDNDCDGIVDATLAVKAVQHTVGAGSHPGSTKEPLGLQVSLYDKSEGSCARNVCAQGISWQCYDTIFIECDPVVQGPTVNGEISFDLPPGDYLVIGGDGSDKHLGVSASALACGDQMQKHLQQLIKVDGKKVAGKRTKITGSHLWIIEPEYIEWTGTEELYPIVLESAESWDVVSAVAPPEGFVADYPALAEAVDNEIEALQFTITDVGSDWVPTTMEHFVGHNGRRQRVISRIGVKLSAELARAKNLDRFGRRLGVDGRPLPVQGHDPRYPQTVEVLGWIEPSSVDPDWTIKIRVNAPGQVVLEVADPSGRAQRALFQGDLEVGEHELHWDGLDSAGNEIRGRNNLVLRTDDTVQTFWLTGRGRNLRDAPGQGHGRDERPGE